MQDIFWGIVIIAIGIITGGSVFLGELSLFNVFFDGLGVFFIGKGAVSMMGTKEEPTANAAQPDALSSVDSNEGTVKPVE